jgi:putative membrane protein
MEIDRHRRLMLAAAATSTVFLVCYLVYHAQVGSVRFTGQGPVRLLYFTILVTHTILAVVIVPMVLRTLYLGLRRRDDAHRRLARWTFPLWLYVSVTGVVIYLMLYRLYPPGPIRIR